MGSGLADPESITGDATRFLVLSYLYFCDARRKKLRASEEASHNCRPPFVSLKCCVSIGLARAYSMRYDCFFILFATYTRVFGRYFPSDAPVLIKRRSPTMERNEELSK